MSQYARIATPLKSSQYTPDACGLPAGLAGGLTSVTVNSAARASEAFTMKKVGVEALS